MRWPALVWLSSAASAFAAAPAVFQSGPGRFEVAAWDAVTATTITTAAEEAWRTLAAPLDLPDGFSSPIFVRVAPRGEWKDAMPFRVAAEPGGIVSVRFGSDAMLEGGNIQRGLVHALLLRLAVARQGANGHVTVPLWLELGAVGWWRTRADAAQLDALKQASVGAAPPLVDLVGWQRGAVEPAEWRQGAVWLMTFLQAEGKNGGEWRTFIGRLLAGDEPVAALATSYPGRFHTASERELWWATGWQQLRRARSLPTLDASYSRRELEAIARFVFILEQRETVVPLAEALAHRRDPAVATEIARHSAVLTGLLSALHPFYRNAGLSLAAALAGGRDVDRERPAKVAAFERDWRDAVELETATRAALDALAGTPAR
jgi:hypothetical protein